MCFLSIATVGHGIPAFCILQHNTEILGVPFAQKSMQFTFLSFTVTTFNWLDKIIV